MNSTKQSTYFFTVISPEKILFGGKLAKVILLVKLLAKLPGSARESHLNEIVNLENLVCKEYIGRVINLLQQQKRDRIVLAAKGISLKDI